MCCRQLRVCHLLLLIYYLCSTSAVLTPNSLNDAVELEKHFGFGDLNAVDLDYGNFTNRALLRVLEDKYNPGSYFLMYLGFILKYKPGQPLTLFLGDPQQEELFRYTSGNSSVAEFSAVSDIVQYNRTKYALSDYLNNCVREYDSETDMVTPLIGKCTRDFHTSIGALSPGDSVDGNANFLSGVLDIELVESGNYFIICDQGYQQLTTYDLSTKKVQLLLKPQDSPSLPSPTSLLLNSDESFLYVTHTNGLSRVNLKTRELKTLAGEPKVMPHGVYTPLTTGSFEQATFGPLSSLTWVVPDEVLIGVIDRSHALVVVDLVAQSVFAGCIGSDNFNTSMTGAQEFCRLNSPTAATFSNNSIFIAAITEGEYNFFSQSSLYTIDTDFSNLKADRAPVIKKGKTTREADTSSYSDLCPTCPSQVVVGDLEQVSLDRYTNNLPSRPIDFMTEDIFKPGEFFFNCGHLVLKYIPGKPVEHVVGYDYEGMTRKDIQYSPGNSTTAKFALISAVAQVNETVMLISDYLNNCVRKYDLISDNITQFVGVCRGEILQASRIVDGDVFSPEKDFLSGPLKMRILKSRDWLLILDHGYQHITKYDFVKKNVMLLGRNFADVMPHPRDILPTLDEKTLYVAHSYGMSRVDLDTFDVELLYGESLKDTTGSRNLYLVPGPFSENKQAYIESIHWLVPDHLIVTIGTHTNEALFFIDLDGKLVYSTCVGGSGTNQTVPGPPGECKLNAPTGIMVTRNSEIYISGLSKIKYANYEFNSSSSIFKMKAKVSLCEFKTTTGNEQVSNSDFTRTIYNQYDYIIITCVPGTALSSTNDTVQCLDDSMWSSPVPKCIKVTTGEDITDVSPRVGQISGGTLVTATGLVPHFGVEVHVNDSNGVMSPVEFTMEPMRLLFRMPEQNRTGDVEVIINLTENITTRYSFTYKDDPVVNHTILSATILSGGFDAIYSVVNIESSMDYTLSAHALNTTYPCTWKSNEVRCDINNFEVANVSSPNPRILAVELSSDGIVMKSSNNLTISVYDDPVFETETISLNMGERLRLEGKGLDVGTLNQYYKIGILMEDTKAILCTIVLISDNVIECEPELEDMQPNSDPKKVYVQLGNLYIQPVSAVFLPDSSTAQPTTMAAGSIAAIVVVTVLSVIVVVVILVVWYRRRETSRRAAEMRINSLRFTKENNDWFVSINVDLKARLDPLLIEPETLKLKEGAPIGQGNFGTIYLGQVYTGEVVKTVAIKTLKDIETSIPMIEKFLEEAVILQDFRHANVLETLGVCIPNTDKPQVILPYMANGDLKSLIQMEHMQFSIGDLMHFAKQIACGMEYLCNNKFIHRDLAARNCLVSDKYIVRIADFGLSKDIYSNDYYRRDEKSGVALPVKWLAIESLRVGKFSTESDVWSYGVLMWELCTRGSQPYPDVDAWDVKAYLEEGRRLHQPSFCPPVVWDVMQSCWLEAPGNRPSFSTIHEFLNKLLEGTECSPQSPYSYIREYTKDIPLDYVENAVEVEPQEYLLPVASNTRKMNDYLAEV